MKKFLTPFAAVAVAALLSAQPAAPKAKPSSESIKDGATVAALPMTKATITAPLVLKDGAIGQPAQTELTEGGKATLVFTVPSAGNYVIHALVNAPSEDANSFFINIDAAPEDPLMIWDMEVTNGFEDRIVSWRGNGDASTDEFTPKVFKLTAGEHKLMIVGREPMWLKSVSFKPAPAK